MAKAPVSIQLYSLRNFAQDDLAGTLKRVADMGYAGVEFAGLYGTPATEVRRIMDDLGMVTSSIHGPLPTSDNIAEVVDTAGALGHTIHVSGPGFGRNVTEEDVVLKAADAIQEGAALMKEAGLRYGLHNHDYEFDREFGGKTPHQILVERCPDVFFEIDTYWVAVGGKSPAETVRALGERAPLLHIKDGPMVREQAMMAVGEGKMDWGPVIDAADPEILEWLIVELDRCDTDMFEAVQKSLTFLTDAGYGTGRNCGCGCNA